LVFHKYDVRKGVSTVSVLLAGHLRKFSIIDSGGPGVFSHLQVFRPALGPPSLLLNGYWGCYPRDEAAEVHTCPLTPI